jgi:uncharacterized protein
MNHIKAYKYNYFIKINDDNYFGYNVLYRTIIRIPSDAFPLVTHFFSENSSETEFLGNATTASFRLPLQWMAALQEAHFIIDAGFDELSYIKFTYYRSLYANDSLSLVLLPTMWCNFSCPYCFEYKKSIFMKSDVEKALVNWIESSFKHKKYIHIAWFGGEPLLAKKTILTLTNQIKAFASSIGAEYEATLTTNGYLMDQKFIESIPSLGIKHVQVTLDGDKADHDTSRMLRNGAGSFDRIFRNIVMFCKTTEDCDLTLRINCTDENYKGIEKLLERFPTVVRARAKIFFRWIWPNKATGYREFASKQRGTEPYRGLAQLYATARAFGWRARNPHLNKGYGYCEVDYLDHYNIDPYGNIYLCSFTFEEADSIGSLLQGKDVIRPHGLDTYVRWYSANPFQDDECVECILLPVCVGGCRKTRTEGGKECIEEKGSLDLFFRDVIGQKILPLSN